MSIFIKYIETWPQVLSDGSISLEVEDLKIAEPDNFGFSLRLTICQNTKPPSGDDFLIYICTRRHYQLANPELRRDIRTKKHIFVERFDAAEIRSMLTKIVADCDKGTWEESLSLLRKRFNWEYEYFNEVPPLELH